MDIRKDSLIIQIVVLITGIILSSFTGWFLYKMEVKAIINEFQKDVDGRAASLYREISIRFETPRSLAILFNSDKVPEFDQFRIEAKNILSRHNDTQAFEWIQRIIHSERAQYESNHHQEYPWFEITEQGEPNHIVTAAERAEYFPAYYVEPVMGNEATFGFDLASNPTRRKALEKVRDTATPLAITSIDLIKSDENKKNFLAFLPIYRGVPLTVENRRTSLKGFILGIFPIKDILEDSALSVEPLGVEMRLVDETLPSAPEILHVHKSRTGFAAYEGITYRKELPDIWGLKLSLIASPTLHYINGKRDSQPLVIFTAGLLAAIFIVLYINIISRRNAIIEQIVVEKTKELNEANIKLKILSRTDGLTRVANRRYMDDFINKEWSRAIRNQSSISFILIDIDFFKLYNDNYGHPAGDECLKMVAAKLQSLLHRPGDLVARYGGEEFALVLTDTVDAAFVADKCRQSIEELQIAHEFSKVTDTVTISVGFCTIAPEENTEPSLIIAYADKALYKAKMAGRNRIEQMVWIPESIHTRKTGKQLA